MGIKKRILSGVVSLIFVFTSMVMSSCSLVEDVSATPIISFEKATTQTAITIPDFDWDSTLNEPYNGKYGIQISKVADFSNVDITAEVPALVSHFVPNRELEKGITYYWRVKYINELNKEGEWSGKQTLEIKKPYVYSISSNATWGSIHSTFAEAIKYTKTSGGFAEIQFEKATYKLTQPINGQSLMEAMGNEGYVIINGQEAKFILTALYDPTSPWKGNGCSFINLNGSKSIQVKNLSIDYADQSLRMIAGEVTTKSYIKAQNTTEFKVKLLPAYRAVFDIGEFNQFYEERANTPLTYAEGYFLNGSQYRNDNDDLNREFQRSDQNDSVAINTKNNGWYNPNAVTSGTTQKVISNPEINKDNEVILTFQIAGNLNYFKIGDYWASVHKAGGDVFRVSNTTVKKKSYVANDIVINDVTVNAGRTRLTPDKNTIHIYNTSDGMQTIIKANIGIKYDKVSSNLLIDTSNIINIKLTNVFWGRKITGTTLTKLKYLEKYSANGFSLIKNEETALIKFWPYENIDIKYPTNNLKTKTATNTGIKFPSFIWKTRYCIVDIT